MRSSEPELSNGNITGAPIAGLRYSFVPTYLGSICSFFMYCLIIKFPFKILTHFGSFQGELENAQSVDLTFAVLQSGSSM